MLTINANNVRTDYRLWDNREAARAADQAATTGKETGT